MLKCLQYDRIEEDRRRMLSKTRHFNMRSTSGNRIILTLWCSITSPENENEFPGLLQEEHELVLRSLHESPLLPLWVDFTRELSTSTTAEGSSTKD